jgi:hypothetical protein
VLSVDPLYGLNNCWSMIRFRRNGTSSSPSDMPGGRGRFASNNYVRAFAREHHRTSCATAAFLAAER